MASPDVIALNLQWPEAKSVNMNSLKLHTTNAVADTATELNAFDFNVFARKLVTRLIDAQEGDCYFHTAAVFAALRDVDPNDHHRRAVFSKWPLSLQHWR